jgi:hypothetical protein
MNKIKISSRLSFITSSVISIIFVGYFGYKGIMVYFVQKAMDDTFIGGSSSDITVTLWFAISGTMAFSMFLFFQFIKIKDLSSQRTIQKGIFFSWATVSVALTVFLPHYIYFILLTFLATVISLLSTITLKEKISDELIRKKETLSEKEIYLLQKLAGVKNPKK